MIDRDAESDATLLSEWMNEMGGAAANGANEYDLKIAVLRAAVALTLRQEPSSEDPRGEDRQYVSSLIRALSRSVGLPPPRE